MGLGHSDLDPGVKEGNANGVPNSDCAESVKPAETETLENPAIEQVGTSKKIFCRASTGRCSPNWCHQVGETLTKMVRSCSAAAKRAEEQPFPAQMARKTLHRRTARAGLRETTQKPAHEPLWGTNQPESAAPGWFSAPHRLVPALKPLFSFSPHQWLLDVQTVREKSSAHPVPNRKKTFGWGTEAVRNPYESSVRERRQRQRTMTAPATASDARPSVPGSGTAATLPSPAADGAAGK